MQLMIIYWKADVSNFSKYYSVSIPTNLCFWNQQMGNFLLILELYHYGYYVIASHSEFPACSPAQ